MGLMEAVLRIRAKQFLGKLSRRWTFRSERLFGWCFNCFDYYDMLTTFQIIFLGREYRFNPQTPRPRIVDCGSNIGLSILFFKREFPESIVLAFEPDPAAFAMLSHNVEQNALRGVEVHNLALAGAAGSRDLYSDPERPGSTATSLFAECGFGERRAVSCARLSDFICDDIDFLKLDIEGAELEVIEDLVRSGKIQRVHQMVIEYHPVLFPARDGYSWLCETLRNNGFAVEIRSGSYPPVIGSPWAPVTLFAAKLAGLRRSPAQS